MDKRINCVMLVDDNKDDNYFHERVLTKSGLVQTIIIKENATVALEYLKSKENRSGTHPDLIFLDINMPGMNGWEFLDAYAELAKELQSKAFITMLTTSDNPDDKAKALAYEVVTEFKSKPLTKQMIEEIADKYFPVKNGG